jgi:hypothetical protein|tara:strand:+ start:1524 stop:1760 length:237 start_codon:yes stop_codon:yes gene_type:complete
LVFKLYIIIEGIIHKSYENKLIQKDRLYEKAINDKEKAEKDKAEVRNHKKNLGKEFDQLNITNYRRNDDITGELYPAV